MKFLKLIKSLFSISKKESSSVIDKPVIEKTKVEEPVIEKTKPVEELFPEKVEDLVKKEPVKAKEIKAKIKKATKPEIKDESTQKSKSKSSNRKKVNK
jgi:hypothetical protein